MNKLDDNKSAVNQEHLLTRNIIWNLLGTGLPLTVAVIAIPILINGLGLERFGILTIVWMVVGYFGLFDFGTARALTKFTAERIAGHSESEIPALFWTAIFIMALFGMVGAVGILLLSPTLVNDVLNITHELKQEALKSFYILSASIPVVLVTSGLRGFLESYQKFGQINTVQIPLGILTFAAPIVALSISSGLVPVVLALITIRLFAWMVYAIMCIKIISGIPHRGYIKRDMISPLLRFGGWLTVTNIVGPLMMYFDRFLVGSLLAVSTLSYYVTPYEILARLQLFSAAMMGVLFPAMTAAYKSDRERMVYIYGRTARVFLIVMFPLTCGIFLFAPEALELWLGPEFSEKSTPVVQWLAFGWLLNMIAQSPFTILQSAGRPDLVAKTHVVELVPYIVLLWQLTTSFGISGTAAAWCIRVVVDTVVLSEIARRTIPELHKIIKRTYIEIVFLIMIFMSFMCVTSLSIKVLVFAIVCVSVTVFAKDILMTLIGSTVIIKNP